MTSRRSRWFPTRGERWERSPQIDLLTQDFDIAVVPYRNAPKAYELAVDGASWYEIEGALTLNWDDHGIADFMRNLASRLLFDHEVWLEVTFDDAPDSAPFQVFAVDGVQRTRTGGLVQELPRIEELPDGVSTEIEWEPTIELDPDRMVRLVLPKAYPGKVLRRVFADLAEVTTPLVPDWVLEHMAGQRRDTPPFDLNEANRIERLRIAQATLAIGWDGREAFLGLGRQISDYYLYWRKLRFLHFCSSIRECVEGTLCRVLTLAGLTRGFTTEVTAKGLHTPQEIEGFIRRFEAGQLPFSDVNDILMERGDGKYANERKIVEL